MTQLLELCIPTTAASSSFRIVTIIASCNNNNNNLVSTFARQWKKRNGDECSSSRYECSSSSSSSSSRGGGLKWRRMHGRRRGGGAVAVPPPSIRAQLEKPLSMELTPITLEAQFDQILETGSPVVIDWMAKWCRKCIYLKPKLERLAAEYHPHVKFYSVDVNDVPAILLKRAQVSKMPTIQLWRNREKEGEVIGGDTAGLVMDRVRAMLAPNSIS